MKRNDISLFAAASLAAAMATPTVAMADSIAATGVSNEITARMTPGQIADVMKRSGYAASMDKDGEGDPMIIARGDEGRYGVVFFDCEKTGALPDRYCTDLEFMAIFEVDRKPSLAKLNKWNAGQAFGKTYLDKDGDVVLEMPINLAQGVSEGFIVSSLEWWQSVMVEFDKRVLSK